VDDVDGVDIVDIVDKRTTGIAYLVHQVTTGAGDERLASERVGTVMAERLIFTVVQEVLEMNEAFMTTQSSTNEGAGGTVKGGGMIVACSDPTYRFEIYPHIDGLIPRSRYRAAKNNIDALKLALVDPPAMLVVDNNDPDLGGIELAAVVQGHDALQNVVIVVTAERFTAKELRTLYRAGVYRTLLWPPDELDIRELVWSVFGTDGVASN
jgi:CheY-like chemotaxis protein